MPPADGMTALVVGASGMLGRALAAHLVRAGLRVVGTGFGTEGGRRLDIRDAQACLAAVREFGPDVVVNCAAYTDVDGCQKDSERAFAVNAAGAGNLADAVARTREARFIHISTDYVFDGTLGRPLREDDVPFPLSVYGQSKLAGEEAVRGHLAETRFLILRVSALYGAGGRNFVDTIRARIMEGAPLKVVNDQLTRPTWVEDLAREITLLAKGSQLSGLYHVGPEGYCSWHECAVEVARLLDRKNHPVEPVPSEQFPRPARRPKFSVLDTERHRQGTGRRMPEWKESLARYLSVIRS